MKNIFAIFDLEADYAASFMEYVRQKNNIPFDVHAFTKEEALLEFAGREHIELLLISAKALNERIKELDIGKIVVLTEGQSNELTKGMSIVYKYQSGSCVLQETLAAYCEKETPLAEALTARKKGTSIYGVFSPVSRCKKTSFALAMGQELARSRPVLYLNLEGYSGFHTMMGRNYTHTLSDVLYFARQQDSGLIHRINGMIATVNHLDYIPPVRFAQDIHQAEWNDWSFILEELVKKSSYQIIILDIGHEAEDIFQLMDRCDFVFLPVLDDMISKAKLDQFDSMLSAWGDPSLQEKIKRFSVPPGTEILPAMDYTEHLLYSEIGNCARRLLEEIMS
ncbi:MAG: hypothetical protein IJ899_07630 [Blautia sp.]|nr:hypothetical protein [Blautia sp.]